MEATKKLWIIFGTALFVAFFILGWFGREIYRQVPPIALYYMQGLNTTPFHGHAALFGVYGLLSLGLVLVVLRRLKPEGVWKDTPLRFAFWAMNIGLALMIALSLLPVGLFQALVSMTHGLWYARSADFPQLPALELLRWLRLIGDTVFIAGVGVLARFVIGLWTGWSFVKTESVTDASASTGKQQTTAA